MLGAALVALVETRAVLHDAASGAPSFLSLALAEMGILAPFAAFVAGGVAAFTIFLEPSRMRTFGDHARRLGDAPVLERSRVAALAPLVVLGLFGFTAIVADRAPRILAVGEDEHAGLQIAVAAICVLLGMLTVGLALLAPLRRLLAAGAARVPALINPAVTGGVALVIALGAITFGVLVGDEQGNGPTPLSVFGVLKRPELDLRREFNLGIIALSSFLAPMALSNLRRAYVVAGAALLVALGSLFVTFKEARAMNEDPHVGMELDRAAPLGKEALKVLRKITDRDHDGYSPYFGGGDCDDHNPKVHEDCDEPAPVATVAAPTPSGSGAEILPLEAGVEEAAAPAAAKRKTIDKDLNVVLITIDTLRPDVGFMGYTTPVGSPTPNLDKLAEKSTVFDRAYSMASYTGKALVPILIGKYPSETQRDGGHYNVYFPSNTFLAERLKRRGHPHHGRGLALVLPHRLGPPEGHGRVRHLGHPVEPAPERVGRRRLGDQPRRHQRGHQAPLRAGEREGPLLPLPPLLRSPRAVRPALRGAEVSPRRPCRQPPLGVRRRGVVHRQARRAPPRLHRLAALGGRTRPSS